MTNQKKSLPRLAAALCAVLTAMALAGCSSATNSDDSDEKKPDPGYLATLELKFADGGNLITGFDGKKPGTYSYDMTTAGGESMEVSATGETDVKVKIDTGSGAVETGTATFTAPKAGGSAVTVKVYADKAGKASEYTIIVNPKQSEEADSYDLSSLSASYADGAQSRLTPNFAQGVKDYTFSAKGSDNANQGTVYIKAKAASSQADIEIFDDDGTRKASAKGSANATITLPKLDESKKVTVQVTRGDGQGYQVYEITVKNDSVVYTWKGSVKYEGSDKEIKAVTVYDAEYKTVSAAAFTNTVESVQWYSFEMNQKYKPKYFVVTLQEAGVTDEHNPKKYETGKLEPAVPASYTEDIGQIEVAGGQIGNRIANANEFFEKLGAGGGSAENYTLASDIDLLDYYENGEKVTKAWTGPAGYKGTLFGNGKTIRNLVLKRSGGTGGSTSNVGLFSSVNGATLQDFTLEVSADASYKTETVSQLYFGGVVGYASAGAGVTLKNITVNGDLEFKAVTSYINIGAIVGVSYIPVTIDHCVSNLHINITDDTNTDTEGQTRNSFGIGGFIGTITDKAVSITDSYATGSITINKMGNRSYYIGGFVGWTYDAGTADLTIKNSYYSGTIVFDATGEPLTRTKDIYAGGFLGCLFQSRDKITITNSAVLSEKALAVTAYPDYSKTGRLVGFMANGSTTSFTNNLVRVDMVTGNTAVGSTSGEGDANTAAGAGIPFADFKNPATWTDTLQWDSDDWDVSGVSSGTWPTLKKK